MANDEEKGEEEGMRGRDGAVITLRSLRRFSSERELKFHRRQKLTELRATSATSTGSAA